jgi:Protein of unknown function, DUF417
MNTLIHILAKSGLLTKDLDYHLIRASMVLIFLAFGYQKWWAYEAQVLIPYISNGPLIFWMYPVFGIRGASWFLGVLPDSLPKRDEGTDVMPDDVRTTDSPQENLIPSLPVAKNRIDRATGCFSVFLLVAHPRPSRPSARETWDQAEELISPASRPSCRRRHCGLFPRLSRPCLSLAASCCRPPFRRVLSSCPSPVGPNL